MVKGGDTSRKHSLGVAAKQKGPHIRAVPEALSIARSLACTAGKKYSLRTTDFVLNENTSLSILFFRQNSESCRVVCKCLS